MSDLAAVVEGLPPAWRDALRERIRQVAVEGWSPEHDDAHRRGELARAAAAYAANAAAWTSDPADAARLALEGWPWARCWWKPKDPRLNLVRAAALIFAEIERLDREAARAAAA